MNQTNDEDIKVDLANYSNQQIENMLLDAVYGYAKDIKVTKRGKNIITLEAIADVLDDHEGEVLTYEVDGGSAYVEDGQTVIDVLYNPSGEEPTVAQTLYFR